MRKEPYGFTDQIIFAYICQLRAIHINFPKKKYENRPSQQCPDRGMLGFIPVITCTAKKNNKMYHYTRMCSPTYLHILVITVLISFSKTLSGTSFVVLTLRKPYRLSSNHSTFINISGMKNSGI